MRKIQQHLRFFTYRRLGYPLALSLTILLLGGVGFWVLEPKVETLSDGLWLAFTTAATVGYGDLVPSHAQLARLCRGRGDAGAGRAVPRHRISGGRLCGQRRARHRTRTDDRNPRPARRSGGAAQTPAIGLGGAAPGGGGMSGSEQRYRCCRRPIARRLESLGPASVQRKSPDVRGRPR